MNPQAIMTPGGIADQFTRGLSGVAQAFAQRSAIDRQAQQDAFAQSRALENDRMAREAFARQGDWRAQDELQQAAAFKLQQEQEARAANAFGYNRQIQNADLLSKGITPPGRDLVTQMNPTEQSAASAFYRGQDAIAQKDALNRAESFAKTFGGMDGLTTPDRDRLKDKGIYENLLKIRSGEDYQWLTDDQRRNVEAQLEYFRKKLFADSPAPGAGMPLAGFDAAAMFPSGKAR